MDETKKGEIQHIVDKEIKKFVDHYENRFINEVDNPDGVINSKKTIVLLQNLEKNLCFIVLLFGVLIVHLEKFWKK